MKHLRLVIALTLAWLALSTFALASRTPASPAISRPAKSTLRLMRSVSGLAIETATDRFTQYASSFPWKGPDSLGEFRALLQKALVATHTSAKTRGFGARNQAQRAYAAQQALVTFVYRNVEDGNQLQSALSAIMGTSANGPKAAVNAAIAKALSRPTWSESDFASAIAAMAR